MASNQTLILASSSPRRSELLTDAGVEFETMESAITESPEPGESARDYAIRTARDKALAVSRRVTGRPVLAADTVVECEGKILGKPVDADEAKTMLRTLSARTHRVTTAFALARAGEIVESEAVTSEVAFRTLSDDEIVAYVATGDPLDKAGAYGIQGVGTTFITRVEGGRDNVMGLPVDAVVAVLRRHGIRG